MSWKPTPEISKNSNIGKTMHTLGFTNYEDLWKWSVENKEAFWSTTVENLNIHQRKKYTQILNIDKGITHAKWLYGAKLNIIDSCFQNDDSAIVLIFKKPNQTIQKVTQKELLKLVNQIANGFTELDLQIGDTIAINLPMTLEAVAVYLAGIKAGLKVATVVDSFSSNEIETRFSITEPKLVFTQDVIKRANKEFPLYEKNVIANAGQMVVIPIGSKDPNLRKQDILWSDFLSKNTSFESVITSPEETTTILFSSGTTSTPKAIPWNHTTPIKVASDSYYHHNIQKNDVVCWPTNLGWMMGPWLVFASLINKACIALFYDAPNGKDFGEFVEDAKVTMLGVIPSMIKQWKHTSCMEKHNWNAIKCFSSTGEVSNPTEMKYLMQLANNKPIIEYCGGTEIGGGYIASTVVQENIPSRFSCKVLGSDFVILDENDLQNNKGEIFLIPPTIGLSTRLLNKNHQKIYYDNTPKFSTQLRRHGDEVQQLENGYFKILGRVDDAMNLGGIKVSATQIEEVLQALDFIKESAAIAVSPKDGGPSKLVVFYVENKSTLSSIDKLKQVKQEIKSKLNPLFKVEDLVNIEVLPRTASNKIMRRTLRDNYKK
jgi:acetyl-CoA synthetase